MNQDLLLHLAQATGLGVGVAFVLWLLRGFAPVRRVQTSLLLTAAMAGLYLVVQGAGLPAETTLLQVIVAAGIMLAANAALQLFDLFLWDYVLGQRRHMTVPRLMVDLFNFVALVIVALAVLNRVFQVDLSGLLVTSTVLSAVIGLALQDMLSNIIAGLALQIERPFAVGDWVYVGDKEGQVAQMNWRTLTLRTRDNHNIFLPNASAARQDIVNYSRPTPLQRLHVQVGVAYRHPPGLVKDVLVRAAIGVEGVAAAPAPEAIVTGYGDFAIQYDLRYYIGDYARVEQIRDAVTTRVWYELRRADMTIPFPIREVTMRALPEDHEARAQERLRREVFAALRPLPLFAPLSDAQIEQLVRGAALQRYTAGEALVQQGEAGDSLFVIKSGKVRVEVRGENAPATTLDELGPADFFGEMSLLTGEPRSASVIAGTETEVVVVDKPDLAAVITADGSVLEALTLALEARMRSAAERVAASTGPLRDRALSQHAALVARIRRFFGVRQ